MDKKASLWSTIGIILTIFAILTWVLWFRSGGLEWTKEQTKGLIDDTSTSLTKIDTISDDSSNSKSDYIELTDFENFNRNPKSYYDKKIIITGALVNYYPLLGEFGYGELADNNDYTIRFAPEIERAFQYGKIYSIKGVVDEYSYYGKTDFYYVKEGGEPKTEAKKGCVQIQPGFYACDSSDEEEKSVNTTRN